MAWRDKADWPSPSPHGLPSCRNQGQSDVLHADHVRQHSRHTQSPGSLHPYDLGRSSRQTSHFSIPPSLTVPQEGGDRLILNRLLHPSFVFLSSYLSVYVDQMACCLSHPSFVWFLEWESFSDCAFS